MSETSKHTDRPKENVQSGVPDAASDAEATGLPDSGRQHSETAASPKGGEPAGA